MTIVKIESEWNNSHAWLSNVDYVLPNWIEVPESLLSTWEELKPFVNLNISDDGVLIGITKAEEIQPKPISEVSDPMAEINLLKKQLKAASDQNEFLEDCIAEMAEIVYA